MPDWLYKYFGDVIQPLISKKSGRSLVKPAIFSDTRGHACVSSSFWVYPSEATILLHNHRFDPTIFYRPRVFLWLPHFFVEKLHCPSCRRSVLEKNGALVPHRIVDVDHCFYMVSWAYYCRDGCKSYFHGWSQALIKSLPAWLQLAFPAVLSYWSGLSHDVVSQLRVGNQHKMGPTGSRSLLLEMHTLRFNRLQAQYLEAVFEQICGHQTSDSSSWKENLHSYIANQFPNFGDFGDDQKYAGFVPSVSYLAMMMNKVIEIEEPDADQHTSCLAPAQLAIDDSHKVSLLLSAFSFSFFFLVKMLNIIICRSISILPKLMVFRCLMHYGHAWTSIIFMHKF